MCPIENHSCGRGLSPIELSFGMFVVRSFLSVEKRPMRLG